MLHFLHKLYFSLDRFSAIRIKQLVLFVNLHSYLFIGWFVEANADHCIGTLPDLFPNDVIIQRALIWKDHGVIVRIILGSASIGVLLLKWSCIGISLGLRNRLLVFIRYLLRCGLVGNILLTLIVLGRLLLNQGNRCLLNLICDTCYRLSIVEIHSLDLLRSRVSNHVGLRRSF